MMHILPTMGTPYFLENPNVAESISNSLNTREGDVDACVL